MRNSMFVDSLRTLWNYIHSCEQSCAFCSFCAEIVDIDRPQVANGAVERPFSGACGIVHICYVFGSAVSCKLDIAYTHDAYSYFGLESAWKRTARSLRVSTVFILVCSLRFTGLGRVCLQVHVAYCFT